MALRTNVRHLRAFAALAHHRHFSRAAQELGLSQPALSMLIAQLEQDLTTALIARTTRSVDLTPAGREFLAAATRLLADFDQALLSVTEYATLQRRRLRIAAVPSLCQGFLPAIIAAFQQAHPDVIIAVDDLQGDQVVEALITDRADLGLGYVSPSDGLAYIPILEDRLVVLSRTGDKPKVRDLPWAAMSGRDIIAMRPGTTIRRLIDRTGRDAGVVLRVVLEPSQMPTAAAYAAAGLGCAILPSSAIPDPLPPALSCQVLVEPAVKRTLSIIEAKTPTTAPAAAAFREMLLQFAKTSPFAVCLD